MRLVEIGKLQPCKAIDLGCGIGENVIYLAQQGFEANGQTYPPQDIAGWLRQAGLTNPSEISLRKSPGFALVVGTKAG